MKKIPFSNRFQKRQLTGALCYACAFLIPFLLLFLIHLYFASGHGSPLMGVLQPASIIWNGIAAVSFLYYVKHTAAYSIESGAMRLLFAVSYGMCGYGIVQESYTPALCLYAVCPLVFLAAEEMFTEHRYLPFLTAMAAALIIHPEGALPLFTLLIVLCVTELCLNGRCSFGTFMHQLGCFLLSFSLAAFRIFPHLESMYTDSSYAGFALSYSPLMALSRLLPFGAPSIGFTSVNGFDIYLGLFPLLPLFFYFVNSSVPAGKRLAYGLFTILLTATVAVSPVRFLLSFCASDNRYSVFCSYMLIFWLLRLAAEGWAHAADASKKEYPGVFILALLVVLASYAGYSRNFPSFAFWATSALLIAFCVLLSLCQGSPKARRLSQTALIALSAAELACSALISADLTFLPSDHSLSASLPWENQSTSDVNEANTDEDVRLHNDTENAESRAASGETASPEDTYKQFMSAHSGSEDIKRINSIYLAIDLDASEYEQYCGTSSPNPFEQLNGAARKAGADGDLFLPVTTAITFQSSPSYRVTRLTDTLFYMYGDQSEDGQRSYIVPFELEVSEPTSDDLYVSVNTTGELFYFSPEQQTSALKAYTNLPNNPNAGLLFELLTYSLDRSVLEQLPDEAALAAIVPANEDEGSFFGVSRWVLAGMVISCLGLLLLLSLFFNSDKQKVYDFLLRIKHRMDKWTFPGRLAGHLSANRMYYLAFFMPFFLYVALMVITDCTPFGILSFFDEDGSALTLPSYMSCYYNLKIGNLYLAMQGGYGFSQYSTHPLIQAMSFYRLLDADSIHALLLLGEGLCLGGCGLSMTYYMTHRLLGGRAKKTDWRLLAPILLYTFNAYMISMHNYTSWYIVYLAFPLILTALDYLMYRKKLFPYVFLLSLSILANLQLSMYICIFLVIYFVTGYFKSFRDFIQKGLRFALCSLLAAGNGFFVISATLLGSSDSLYRSQDAVFPTPGLHTSFLEQWKKHMLFTDVRSISADEGMVNIYCSILLLILLLVYFSSRQISLRTKLRKLVPIIFLYVSFNGQVLSYLWNGLHYQSKVPNRYAFLLTFLFAELSYDAIRQLRQVSALRFAGMTGIVCAFLIWCQLGSSGNSTFSFAASLIVCGCYLLCHLLLAKRQENLYGRILLLLLTAEVCTNSVYSYCHFNLTTLRLLNDISSTTKYIEEKDDQATSYFRTTFASLPSGLVNSGMLYNTDTVSLFNSFVTAHQNNLSMAMGFHSGGNAIRSNHNSTPMGLSLAAVRYIFVPYFATYCLDDLAHYRYLGTQDIYYVFENPDALSLGFYVPYEIGQLRTDEVFVPDFSNYLAALCTGSDNLPYTYQDICYSSDGSAEDSYCFVNLAGQLVPAQEARRLMYAYGDNVEKDGRDLHLRFRFTPKASGYTYFFHNEFVCLGYARAGEEMTVDVMCPNQNADMYDYYTIVTLNEEALETFYENVRANQLEHVQIGNDKITGTTDYEQEGYTMFSIAYDRSWHAYIDGQEVETEDPCGAMLCVRTPAGKHTLTLKYIPYGMRISKTVSLAFWILTTCIFGIFPRMKRRRKELSAS